MEPYGQVYKITHILSGKSYIGQTIKPIEKRLKKHLYNGKIRRSAIGSALSKYGIESFNVTFIGTAFDQECLNQMEYELVKAYDTISPNGYNLKEGGQHSKMSEESKKKMSIAQTGKKQSQETIERRRIKLIGRKMPPEAIKRSADKQRGIPKSPETCQRMRMAKLGTKQSLETIAKRVLKMTGKQRLDIRKPVIGIKIDGSEVVYYPYAIAAKEDGFNPTRIAQCCLGKERQHKGFLWHHEGTPTPSLRDKKTNAGKIYITKRQPVVGTHIYTGQIIKFDYIGQSILYGFTPSRISDAISGRRKTHKKYTWKRA